METTEFLKILGYRIRAIRNSRGLSQEKFAEVAGVHPTYVSEIELGKANASIGVFERIANGLGMTLSELVETNNKDDDNDFMNFVSMVRMLDVRQRKVFIETADALLKGMKEF
jgi:transcriptional regulator with XRE-family HTH domain